MMRIAMHTRHEAGHVNYTNAYKKADYGGDDRTKYNTGPWAGSLLVKRFVFYESSFTRLFPFTFVHHAK